MLVAKGLIQRCLLGADFLTHNGCVVDLQSGQMSVAGERVPLWPRQRDISPLETCHVAVLENTIVPPLQQVQLLVNVQTRASDTMDCDGMVEPSTKFIGRHDLLLARSVSPCIGGRSVIRLLNPTMQPVTIYAHETLGSFFPLSPTDEVCTVHSSHEAPICHNMASRETEVGHRNHALQQLKQGAEGLSQEETMALRSLLNSYVDVFALVDGEFGKTNKIKHRINIQGAEPVKQPGRLWPFHKREEVRGMLSDMLKRGVIEESHSPWASPIVVVQKKDGTSRFCVDFRRVNALTIKDAQPLLRIDDTLDVLAGSCWFSTLDLASGYWQVEVDDKDREKTAFSTPFGLYQFKVMPFGLCNAPATFQRLMELVLLGLHWTSCLVYLDDIIIFSKSVNEHLRQLEEVLDRLRGAGLKTKPSKCQLCRKVCNIWDMWYPKRGYRLIMRK